MKRCSSILVRYNEGVIDDDSEVALSYSVDPAGRYVQNTVPLVNVRATLQDHPNPEWRLTAAANIGATAVGGGGGMG